MSLNDETNSWGVFEGESESPKLKMVLGSSGRPMVISSGMQSMDTMKQVYQIVKPLNPNFCFLQCTSAYPLQPEDVNLRVISVSVRELVISSGCSTVAFLVFSLGKIEAFLFFSVVVVVLRIGSRASHMLGKSQAGALSC